MAVSSVGHGPIHYQRLHFIIACEFLIDFSQIRINIISILPTTMIRSLVQIK